MWISAESYHFDDKGTQKAEDIFSLTDEEKKALEVYTLDILDLPKSKVTVHASEFSFTKAGLEPLKKGWIDALSPVMCCYKLVKLEFPYFGFQMITEKLMTV